MLSAKDYPKGTLIYTFVADNGTNTHIDSIKLRAYCLRNKDQLNIRLVPVRAQLAEEFVRDNCINFDRFKTMTLEQAQEPIILGKFGNPDVIMIDGHHRYYLHYRVQSPFISAFIVPRMIWKRFQIEGLKELSKDELRQAPRNGELEIKNAP